MNPYIKFGFKIGDVVRFDYRKEGTGYIPSEKLKKMHKLNFNSPDIVYAKIEGFTEDGAVCYLFWYLKRSWDILSNSSIFIFNHADSEFCYKIPDRYLRKLLDYCMVDRL